MKKLFIFMGIVALTLSTVSCNSKEKELDKLSYTVGVSYGLQVHFDETFDLDEEIYLESLLGVYNNGEVDESTMMADQQRALEFQYNQFQPYMMAMYQGTPEEELPAIFNEEYSKEEFTRISGRMAGASLLEIKDFISIDSFIEGYNDAFKVEDRENIFENLRVTEEEANSYMEELNTKMTEKMQAEQAKIGEENASASAEWLAEIEQMEGVQKTESGLLYRIDREGSDVKATADTDVVEVNYEGKLRTGDVFDSSYERGESISFPLNGVIKGWTEGMKLVGEGGQITLWIPAELAYGERGAGSDIGPNEALEFKVELIKVNPEN